MTPPVAESNPTDARSLAASLTPELVRACDGKLSNVSWFRTDWQRGGAATATAELTDEVDGPHRVVVKLPVVQRELIWTRRLQGPDGEAHGVTPRVYYSGDELGGYDLAWLVIEHLGHGPLAVQWTDDSIPRIAEAAGRFYAQAGRYEVDRPVPTEDWRSEIKSAQKKLVDHDIPDKPRWKKAFKALNARLDDLVEEWRSRTGIEWIHGDLHPANAMCRSDDAAAPVCLIDLAEIRPGHWVEDAVYLERLLWSRPDRLRGIKPVKAIAAARRKQGLHVDENSHRLAMIRRALLAGTALCYLKSEGNPRHLAACLDWLETANQALK